MAACISGTKLFYQTLGTGSCLGTVQLSLIPKTADPVRVLGWSMDEVGPFAVA